MTDPVSLAGSHVLVTGAASGIGRQIARDLYYEQRCHLILLDINESSLTAFGEDLRSQDRSARPPSVKTFTCDITSPESVERFLSASDGEPLDVLVNNAGIFYSGSFEKMAVEDFEKIIQVNLLGTIRMTRALLPRLLDSRRASIITIASLAGLIGAPGMCAYSASKFGLVGFSEALRGELRDRVHVSTVCPAFVRTNIARNSLLNGEVDEDEKTDRIEAMDRFITRVGTSAKKVSEAVVRAIQGRESMTLVTRDARILYTLKRFLPDLSDSLVARGYRKLLKKGVLRT